MPRSSPEGGASGNPDAAKGPLPVPALVVAVVAAAVHVLLDAAYRPWAQSVDAEHLGFAGSFTQVTSVVGISAVMVLVERRALWVDRWHEALVVGVPVVAMALYEVLQAVLPWGTFSLSDLAWTGVGGLIVSAVKRTIYDPAMRPVPSLAEPGPTL